MARKKKDEVVEVAEAVVETPAPVPTKEPTGLRHAIRLNVMSAKEAFRKLKSKYTWIDPRTKAWYENRISREKA